MAENHVLGYNAETAIAYKNLQGQKCRLDTVVSYEFLTMILARVLVPVVWL